MPDCSHFIIFLFLAGVVGADDTTGTTNLESVINSTVIQKISNGCTFQTCSNVNNAVFCDLFTSSVSSISYMQKFVQLYQRCLQNDLGSCGINFKLLFLPGIILSLNNVLNYSSGTCNLTNALSISGISSTTFTPSSKTDNSLTVFDINISLPLTINQANYECKFTQNPQRIIKRQNVIYQLLLGLFLFLKGLSSTNPFPSPTTPGPPITPPTPTTGILIVNNFNLTVTANVEVAFNASTKFVETVFQLGLPNINIGTINVSGTLPQNVLAQLNQWLQSYVTSQYFHNIISQSVTFWLTDLFTGLSSFCQNQSANG